MAEVIGPVDTGMKTELNKMVDNQDDALEWNTHFWWKFLHFKDMQPLLSTHIFFQFSNFRILTSENIFDIKGICNPYYLPNGFFFRFSNFSW